MNIPTVSKEFERFDFAHFDSAKNVNSFTSSDGTYTEYDAESSGGYFITIQPLNSCFQIFKKFYKNGNIREKGLVINKGNAKKGEWYYFSETGVLEREENSELHYKYNFDDLLLYLKKEDIPVTIGRADVGFHTEISNNSDSIPPQWYVSWLKDSSKMPNTIEKITIDGKSGKIISKSHMRYFNN